MRLGSARVSGIPMLGRTVTVGSEDDESNNSAMSIDNQLFESRMSKTGSRKFGDYSDDKPICQCCNRHWKNKRSLLMHLRHQQISVNENASNAIEGTPYPLLNITTGSTSENIDHQQADSNINMVPAIRRSERIRIMTQKETSNMKIITNSAVKKARKECPNCGTTYVRSHSKCSVTHNTLSISEQASSMKEGDSASTINRIQQVTSQLVKPEQTNSQMKEKQCNSSVTRLHGMSRKHHLTDMHSLMMSNLNKLKWTNQQIRSEDVKYLKLKKYHDVYCGLFDNLATMKLSKEIEDIVATKEMIEMHSGEDAKDPKLYTWSKSDETKLNSLTASAKQLEPPHWPWGASENTTQGTYNRDRMAQVVTEELQYKIMKCPKCGVTVLLVGKEQIKLEQCIDCLELSMKKPETQQKLREAWERVRPKDEVPKKVCTVGVQAKSSTACLLTADLPTLNPSEQALIALVQPAVTIKRNYMANMKYKQESINILQAPEKIWCKVLPRKDLTNRFVVIERRFRDAQVKYMVADPNKVRDWLQYLFTHHETYMKKTANNQLELSEEALTALEQQSELASVDYDDSIEDSDSSPVDETEYPPPSAELDSGLSSTELYTFDKHEMLYTKKQSVLKMVGEGKMMLIKEDDPSRKRTFDPHVSTNIAFPHLYPNGEASPTDYAEHTVARHLLKKLCQFAQINSDSKPEWRHAENGVHVMHEYARIVEMNVHALVGWYINQSPERSHIPIDSLLDAFRQGLGEHGIIDSHMPELHGLMTCIRNSREKWYSEQKMLEVMSRDFGEANLFFTLNMDARAWPDVRKLLYELDEGTEKEMPPDYFEIDTNKFSKMVDKYAIQLSIYLKHRAQAFSHAFLCDICRIELSRKTKKSEQDRTETGWYWQRVEFTSTRGIQHWHCVAKLPGVLDTSILARMVQTMRVVRTELKFGNIKDYAKAWEVIEVGLLASRYLVLLVDSLSTCAFFNKEMSTDAFEEDAVIDISSLRQDFTESYFEKDITMKTHPCMRRFDDVDNCDPNPYMEIAKVASVSCIHNCIANICGGDMKTGKGCRFQYPHKNLKYTVPTLIQIDSERMELQLLPRRTCDRVPNVQKLFLQYYRGNHDFTVLADAAHKLRYVSKYVSKTGKIESLLTEVIESLDQKSSSLMPPSIKEALSNILLADCSHKAYMSMSELAYNALDLPKVDRSFSFVKTVAFYPRGTVIEECQDSESGVVELSDRTEYSAYAERCRDSTEVRGKLLKTKLEQMNFREFAESINYKWVKKGSNGEKSKSTTGKRTFTSDDSEEEADGEQNDEQYMSTDGNVTSTIQWRCRDVRSGHWIMSEKRVHCHCKWSNPLYTDQACNYVPDDSVNRFSQLEWDKRKQLERVYMEMVCYIPWKDNPDQCFLPADVQQILKNDTAADPDAGCRYSLIRLHEYHRQYMEMWNAGKIAPAGSQWHRDNQYSYTMYLSSQHNRSVKQDRATNNGVFMARYEADDELANTSIELSPHITTLNDADEYPYPGNYLPYDILQEIENQEPLKPEDLFVAFPEHSSWKDIKDRATRKSSGLFMASPPPPTMDISQMSPMQKLAVDLIDLKNNKVKVLYIYGKAGSGKTAVAQFLCQKFKGRVQAAAGTGKAASNFNGPTIHGAFSWSADITNQSSPLTAKKKQLLQVFYKDTELFIFDEINASPAYTLYNIERTMRELFSPINIKTGKQLDLPFGGKRVVFLGDSAQLRPIQAAAIYDKAINAKLFGYKSQGAASYINNTKAGQQIYRRYLMKNCIYLVQGYRNNGLLQQIMDNLRDGQQTEDDLDKLLYQRQKYPDLITKRGIHYSNESAMLFNCHQLWSDCKVLKRHMHVSRASYHMTDTNSNIVGVLSKIAPSDFGYAQDVLCLAVGAEVRLITNLDTTSGLVTNLTGTVIRVLYDNNDKDAVLRGEYPPPYCIIIKFATFKGFVRPQSVERWFPFNDHSLVPIYRQKFQIKAVPETIRKLQQRKYCYREQFPLDLSGHLTAHRAQGQTFKNCTLSVNLGFESPQNKIPSDAASIAYVACTRISDLKNLFVSPIFPSVWEKMGHMDRDQDRRDHEKELKLSAESFARNNNVYHVFVTEQKYQYNDSSNDTEWNDITQHRLLPRESSVTMLSSDSEIAAMQEAMELNHLFTVNSSANQRFIGIDQGIKTFSMVAIDKSNDSLPVVVGAEQCNLQELGLPENFNTGDLILMLRNHTSLFSWMSGDSLPDSPSSNVSRVIVLIEQMSLKNRNHKRFNEEFGKALQQCFDFRKCIVKMSQPHVHRKNGPMFKLGEDIVKELNLEALSTQCNMHLSPESPGVGQITEQQRAQQQQYRKKKRMSSAIFKYFITATDPEQTAMQILVSKTIQLQWMQQTVRKYDDLGDALLHALNELLCGGSRYQQLIPTSPTLHRNRTVVITLLPSNGYWVTIECYYNTFLIQDFGTFKTHLINKTYNHPSTIQHILTILPGILQKSIQEFQPTVDFLTNVDHINVIIKQLTGFQKARISRATSGALTNATVEAMKKSTDNAIPDGQTSASTSKTFGWQYVKSIKGTGQKIQLQRSSGKHLNAVMSCLNWMKNNVPEFVRDRPLNLSSEGRQKFYNALHQLAKTSEHATEDTIQPAAMEFIRLSSNCQKQLLTKSHTVTPSAQKILADLTLIALNNNCQYISAISTNYRRPTVPISINIQQSIAATAN